jgi:DNA repair exonuclease SbcCD ATPase subunit
MSFLDKLKRLFEETPKPKAGEMAAASAPVHLNELSARVGEIVGSVGTKNHGLKQQIEKRIALFEGEVNNSIEILRNVDLSKRKEYERIKITVQDNLHLYVDYLKKLLNDLKKIDEKELAGYFNRIFSCLNEFNRNSRVSYEKATYLIGREMASARSLVKQFGQDISTLAEQNKPFFEETKQAEKLSNLNNELEESKKLEKDIRQDISYLDKKIESLGNEAKSLGNEVIDIKNSSDYRKEAEEKQEHLKEQGDLDLHLQTIKQKIDFKALARVFHHDKKKAQLIKEYSHNFKEALKEDETLKIIEMTNDSQNLDVSSLKELRALLQSSSFSVSKTEKKISELEDKMGSFESEKAAAKARINEENKKLERIAKKQEKIISELRNLLAQRSISLKEE